MKAVLICTPYGRKKLIGSFLVFYLYIKEKTNKLNHDELSR